MSYKLLVKKLEIIKRLEKKDGLITSDDIKDYCKSLNLNYNSSISYLLNNHYIERIFRKIFYIRSLDEKKNKISNIDLISIISKAFEIKKIDNWYFGLETALKFNNLTHEHFITIFIINDKIKNTNPINILGYKVKIIKISSIDYSFGIIKSYTKENIPYFYSDVGRTFLDMAFLLRYNGKTFNEIKNIIYSYDFDIKLVNKYINFYPKTIIEVFK
jgi:predicted transcriptional regulator of viral defense system